ncbi:MAG TPA: EAL domain-containing protein [Candidatus Baltobacteraceae bacterium]|jgi:diguanylate cyclase (GGDEF)-like protein/PAS domain S-box-containing protein|nr:EAL domain-containing protein [Candidatus Baltobacteraceae bacterium]
MSTWLANPDAFESFFRNAPYGIAAVDRNGVFVACNPAFTKITGFPQERLIGCSTHETDRVAFRVFADEALDAAYVGRSLSRDLELLRADGTTIWCEITSIPVTGDSGVHVFFALTDVTWRSAAENSNAVNEIGQARANFRLLFEHNPAVVLAIDTENKITDVNPAGLRVSGYAREAVIGRCVADFVPPSQRDRLRVFLSQAMRGETVSFPIDAYAADGLLIEYEATALPIISQNRVAGVYGLLENITERMRAERTVAAQREELLDLEGDFRSLFDHNPDGIVLLATDGTVLDINRAGEAMAGALREQIAGRTLRELVDAATFERVSAFLARAVDGETVRYEVTSSNLIGGQFTANITLFPKYAQGVIVAVYCMMQDITQSRVSARKLEQQSQRIRDLYLLATGPDSDAQVMAALQTGCRLLAMESGAIVAKNGDLAVDLRYDTLEPLAAADSELLEIARRVMALREPAAAHRGEEGDSFRSWIASRLVVAGAVHGALVFSSQAPRNQEFEETDLDTLALMSALVGSALERRRARGALRTLAYFDSLTGLPNRAYFQERLRDALIDVNERRGGPLAVVYFDLDRFKDINDTLGHAMGDRFLQMVAHRLKAAVADRHMIARMTGGAFAVLVRQPGGRDDLAEIALDLLREIEKPYRLEGFEQFITASAGVSMYPADGRDDQTLIKNAEIAMYEVKDRGGNGYYFYDPVLEAPITTRLSQEKLLRRAIENDEFTLHFQPIVDVSTEEIRGVEALVRWNDPARGLVYPDEFIPTAEASGLIVRLGEWIVKHAAECIRGFHEKGPLLSLAVNISARQFHQQNLCERLQELLDAAGLDPRFVEIEITESMAISDIPHAVDTVRKIKRLGAHIGVDDFGTGHSSLNYLRKFEIDHLKIDRSFIAGIGREPSDETIVRAMIAMGHSLGLKIVAEGVETQSQLTLLRQYGCDRAQGYLFSRPLDSAALATFIDASRGTGRSTE